VNVRSQALKHRIGGVARVFAHGVVAGKANAEIAILVAMRAAIKPVAAP
jgi:hypothetical protein